MEVGHRSFHTAWVKRRNTRGEHNESASPYVCFTLVISTGRRNTLAKSLCWRLEVQRFPRPLVELACHLVQLGLGVRREIKALGEVLAQQAIGVFA